MPYSLSFTRRSFKELEKINEPYYSRFKVAIFSLADNPRPQGYKKLKGRDGYRIRVGDYRIIYDIFDIKLIIEIIAIGHRNDIYGK